MGPILVIAYLVAGYWAVGKVLYENKIIIYSSGSLFARKIALGTIFGWIFIPIAIIKMIAQR